MMWQTVMLTQEDGRDWGFPTNDGIAFVAFAYVGEMFGFDFSTGVHAIELPLDLDIK